MYITYNKEASCKCPTIWRIRMTLSSGVCSQCWKASMSLPRTFLPGILRRYVHGSKRGYRYNVLDDIKMHSKRVRIPYIIQYFRFILC